MSPVRRGPDEWLPEVFERLAEHEPPRVSLESILELGRKRVRRRFLLGGGFVAGAAILLAIAIGGSKPEPPVHLDLRVVDMDDPADGEDELDVAAWSDIADESRGR